jgi:hypothetical protein
VDWGRGTETALCGFNHEHSAAAVSLPVAPEVVTRNSGAGADSIVTMAPDRTRSTRSLGTRLGGVDHAEGSPEFVMMIRIAAEPMTFRRDRGKA